MKLRTLALFAGALGALAAQPAAADVTIYEIQLGVIPNNTAVLLEGVVVTGVGKFGYFVQEPTPDPTYQRQYSGIWIFTNQNHSVTKGDLVNVSGRYYEYFNFSEVDMTLDGGSTVKIGATTVPAPVNVTISEVNDTGAFAEAYESVLVRVDRLDATLFSRQADGFNEWYLSTSATIGVGDSLLVDNYSAQPGEDFEYDIPSAGTAFSFAQGVLTYSFSKYKLAPRNCDIDLGTPCKAVLKGAYSTSQTTMNVQFGVPLNEPTAEDIDNYELASGFSVLGAQLDNSNPRIVHLTTEALENGDPEQVIVNNVQSAGGLPGNPNQTASFRSGITAIQQIQFVTNPAVNDVSPLNSAIVTVEAKITATDGNYFYLQDAEGGQWDGLYSRVARTGLIAVGDKIQVTGSVTEFNGSTQITYRTGHDNFVNSGPIAGPVVTNTVTEAQIPYRNPTKIAERWENQLVKINNCTVDSLAGTAGPVFGEWLLQQAGPDTAGCDLNGIALVSYPGCIGDIIDLTGVLRYSFGSYRIAPRTNADITVDFDNPACVAVDVSDDVRVRPFTLGQNQPNPFTFTTEIRLALPRATRAKVEIMDVGGRVVRRLLDADLVAGSHTMQWDGRNDLGHEVGAGTYFYRLRTAEGESARKMLVVR